MYSQKLRNLVLAGMPPKWLYLHTRRRYVEQKILATPPWVSHKEMMALQVEKLRISEQSGIRHVLDHVVPLNHPMVCGLNVPWNIQVVPYWHNSRKSNNYSPDQLELIQ